MRWLVAVRLLDIAVARAVVDLPESFQSAREAFQALHSGDAAEAFFTGGCVLYVVRLDVEEAERSGCNVPCMGTSQEDDTPVDPKLLRHTRQRV